LFELDKKLYMINIVVEGHEAKDNGESGGGDPGDDDQNDLEDENREDDGFDDLEDPHEDMETDLKKADNDIQFTPKGDQGASGSTVVQLVESGDNVRSA
jgi:hypothetical protein